MLICFLPPEADGFVVSGVQVDEHLVHLQLRESTDDLHEVEAAVARRRQGFDLGPVRQRLCASHPREHQRPPEGVVEFEKLSENRTRILLRMTYGPETFNEKLGDAIGAVKLEARRNLKHFKELIEGRGVETGAWRGTVQH